jgi:signal transduction histidine kinase
MTRSLGFRLFAAVALVVVAAVAAVGLLAGRAARLEFDHFLTRAEEESAAEGELDPLAERLEAAYAHDGEAGLRRALDAWGGAHPEGPHALLFPPDDGEPLSGLGLEGWLLRRVAPQTLEGERHDSEGEVVRVVLKLGSQRLTSGERPLGELYLLPVPFDGGHLPAEAAFRFSLDRWLFAAVAGVGLLSLALAAVTLRRLLSPVRELTDATRAFAAGELDHRVPVRRDDELGELAASFNTMAFSLARERELQRNMVSDTAHELRTPLTNLRCQIEALEDGLIEDGPAVVASLNEEVLQLQRLVEDLQELALADAGELRIAPIALRLGEEVRGAVGALRRGDRWPEADGARIELDPALDRLPRVLADPARLRQILTNLLLNALDHTPPGGSIRISGRTRGEEIEVSVEDDGPGVPAEHLPHLFERFYRTDPSRQRATGGTGLGLAIVRQLVEAQGGRVSAENAAGAGARFTFAMPRANAQAAADEASR